MKNIYSFQEITKDMSDIVGGKGASLGELSRAGVPVPPGFVITTNAYKEIRDHVKKIEDFEQEILKSFDGLEVERVAVRSSAIAEDSPSFSWAGQLESYLNVKRDKLLENIQMCWKSIQSPRALAYAEGQNIPTDKLLVAVVIQTMVDSEASGIMFSINPLNKNEDEIMIEAGRGLGETIVQGMITPNSFVVDKKTMEIKLKNISNQKLMMIYKTGETIEVSIPDELKNSPVLQDNEIQELARLAIQIEQHYGTPQDIEWASFRAKFYILQSRPITTL